MEDESQANETDALDEESAVPANEPNICEHCGAEIKTKEWHPLVTQTDNDGNFCVYAFCDESCRNEWAEN